MPAEWQTISEHALHSDYREVTDFEEKEGSIIESFFCKARSVHQLNYTTAREETQKHATHINELKRRMKLGSGRLAFASFH